MNEADPSAIPEERLAVLRTALARRAESLDLAARRVQEAADPECTHDLRVGARWLEAMLRAWECLFPTRPRKAAIRALRRTRRRVGRARELQVHVSLLEPRVAQHGEPAALLLQDLKHRLSKRITRAATKLRAKRFKRLLGRIDDATSVLGSVTAVPSHVFARARARALEAGAVAQVALRLASTQDDDWLLHQARIATKKWRYSVECVQEIAPLPESRVLESLREIQTALGAVQDRTTLIEEIGRYGRRADRAGLQGLLDELDAEKQAAVLGFKRLATAMNIKLPTVGAARPVKIRPIESASPAAPDANPGSPDERWEHMAQWLLGKSAEK